MLHSVNLSIFVEILHITPFAYDYCRYHWYVCENNRYECIECIEYNASSQCNKNVHQINECHAQCTATIDEWQVHVQHWFGRATDQIFIERGHFIQAHIRQIHGEPQFHNECTDVGVFYTQTVIGGRWPRVYPVYIADEFHHTDQWM